MTPAERLEIECAVPPPMAAALSWAPHADGGFLRLLTPGGCPLLSKDDTGRAVCTVHAVRPYNCRRWGCYRSDYTQPADMAGPVPVTVLRTRDLRRQYARMQRKAQRWAVTHGWVQG